MTNDNNDIGKDVEVVAITRGHVRVRIGDRVATVSGELLLPMAGEPDFVVFTKMFTSWDAPHDKEYLDTKARKEIFKQTRIALGKLGYVVVVE